MCVNELPKEAHDTLSLIWKYGDDGSKFPFPKKDGSTFDWRPNDPYPFPRKPQGYYKEYTVITPGAPNRGKLRIVTGGDPKDKVEDWWSDDHYDTFHPIDYTCDTSGPNAPSPMGSR
ncbi:ribonuclease domain-containing protein [Streptomyces sp. 5-10]|uniref:ribonuclease domain-containing protein n=1 Tax=Streptomyces sp. 5-10 TaxID=878925 RepID=UPI00295E9146|nr:ribonuclease domain-containing protein [Streptomyces sp. 5-10]